MRARSGAQCPERCIEQRRKQQHGEAVDKGDFAPEQAEPDQHRRHRDGNGGEELENQRRQESEAQHLHGLAAITVGRPGDESHSRWPRRAATHIGETGNGVEKMAAELRHRRLLLLVGLFC